MQPTDSISQSPTIAIIGGGLAGLAAAVAAIERGFCVELFEQANSLGGRAGSFVDSETGDRIDYCQHVAMGCCTALLDFCRRTGVDDCFNRSAELHFIGPDGAQCDFAPRRWLPPPLHLLPGLMKLKYLSLGERWGIVRALRKLVRQDVSPLLSGEGPGVRVANSGQWAVGSGQSSNASGNSSPQSLIPNPSSASPHPNPLPKGEGTSDTHLPAGEGTFGSPLPTGEETIGDWLRAHGQSDRVIERFWSVVLVSALGETVDRASLAAARKVFCEGFVASRGASDLVLPRFPLGAIFHDRVGRWLADRGMKIHLQTPVRQIEGRPPQASAVILSDGTRRTFDRVIVAAPWRNVRRLLADDLLAAMPALANVEQIEPAAITAVHLWFDRPIMPLPHAVLVGRLSQWVFADPQSNSKNGPHHYQVVISASHRLAEQTRDELLAEIRRELEAIWPAVGAARLLHGRVATQPAAVFSVTPGVDRFRPPQQTSIENLALAGDWTATGWPATMEGAVRSGFAAVEVLSRRTGGC